MHVVEMDQDAGSFASASRMMQRVERYARKMAPDRSHVGIRERVSVVDLRAIARLESKDEQRVAVMDLACDTLWKMHG